MTRALAEFSLDARGLAYVKAQLADAHSLGAALLEIADLGETFTLAPPGTPPEQIYSFDAGGLLVENLDSSNATQTAGGTLVPIVGLGEARTRLVAEAMKSSAGSICIANDVNPTWTEARTRGETTALGVNDEVYHIARAGASATEINDACVGLLPWHGVTAVCGTSLEPDDAREASLDALRRTALSATLITCSAYDGEGFVAWRRKS